MTRALFPALLTLVGCVHISDDEYEWRLAFSDDATCTEQTWYTDGDGDGYGDPTDPVHACDQPDGTVDNHDDCDDTDPAVTVLRDWYRDSDGDGWGTSSTTQACVEPPGYADQTGDCDDVDLAVNPDATESCATAADDDCDGATDAVGATGCTDWYQDADGDGYGGGTPQCSCQPMAPYTTDEAADCDDDDDAVNPDATEVCYDGVDNDCDGAAPGCGLGGDLALADAPAALLGDASNDGAGYAVAFAGDIDGDGALDVIVGAPTGDLAARQAGQAYVVYGPVTSDVPLSTDAFALRGLASSDQAAREVAAAGDLDHDGYGDVAVAAPLTGTDDAGVVYVAFGPFWTHADLDEVGAAIEGEASGDLFGFAVATAPRIDGSGTPGLWVGAYHVDTGGSAAGAAYLLDDSVSSDGVVTEVAVARVLGSAAGDRLGYGVAGDGDLDGDGISDAVIAADRAEVEGGASNGGVLAVFLGPVEGELTTADADGLWWGTVAYESAGYDLAMAGDLDGDGRTDVLAGAPGYNAYAGAGMAYVVYGPADELAGLDQAQAAIEGVTAGDGFGSAVSAAGDVDLDGNDDVLVGASTAGTGGVAWLVRGPVEGTLLAASAAWSLSGGQEGDGAGWALAGGADLNGDGASDLMIGAPGADGGSTGSGVAYVIFGGGL